MKTTLLVIAGFVFGLLAGRQLYHPRYRVRIASLQTPFERFQVYERPGVRVFGLEKDATVSLESGHTREQCAKLAVAMQGINTEIPGLPRGR
jgi:hypothetical protein